MLSKRSSLIVVACLIFPCLSQLNAAAPAKDAMTWSKDLATAQQEATRTGKLILIHFSGENCPPCVRVQKNVFSQPNVGYQIASRFASVEINGSAQPHIARQFQVTSWPTDLILTAEGQELHRMTSPQDPRVYLTELGKAAWRARSLSPEATQIAAQRQTPQGQVAVQSVPQQRVPQPNATREKPIAAALEQGRRLTQSQTQQGYQTPLLAPRGNVNQQQRNPFTQQVAATAKTAVPPQTAAAPLQTTQTIENKFATAAGNQVAPASAVATVPPTPTARPVVQAAAQTIPTNPHVQQTPQAPARPAADLYPQTSTGQTATQTPPAAIQPVAYNQPAATVSAQLPPGKNPFDANSQNGTGSVMLTNPFLSQTSNPAASPQPYAAATQPTQPQQHQAPQATLFAAQQPSPPASPVEPQAPASAAVPAMTLNTTVAPSAPQATLAQTAQIPTPALTPATPPQQQQQQQQQQAALEPIQLDDAAPEQPQTNGQPQIEAPTGAAMDGYCSVTLHHEDRWVKGDPRWGAQHRGKVFLFHTASAQERFLNDPDKYSPLLSGFDPVVFHETGELKTGFRDHGVRYQDMTCLFSSEESLQRFWESPWQFTQTAKQAMRADTTVR